MAVSPSLKQRIKWAARAHSLPVLTYVTGIEDSVPSGTGRISDRMIRRFDELRAQFKTPLTHDSADLIREARGERLAQL